MNAEKLTITLPAEMARLIRREVERGAYASDSEVVREAVRLWQERREEREQRLGVIRSKLQEAVDDPVRISGDEMRAHFERLTAEAEKRNKP